MEGIVEHAGEVSGGHPRTHQVGTSDVADEQRVSRQDGVWNRTRLGVVKDQNADGFQRVSGSFEETQNDVPHPDLVAIVHRHERKLRRRRRAEIQPRAGSLG